MSNDSATQLLTEAIAARAMPGAVIVAGTSDTITLEQAFGNLSYDGDSTAVELDTIYDLASLTKVIVTTSVAMLLWERKQLDLEAPVKVYLPEFSGDGKDAVVIKDLLAHCGGLLWWTDLYTRFEGRSLAEAKQGYIEEICALPLDYPPRAKTVYSDLGFLLLGEILERLTKSSLDQLASSEIFEPLGMEEIQYNPPEALHPRIAPTENDPWRGCVLKGVVHDENAYGLGGIAPHAGLFSTARSVVPFAQVLLKGGAINDRRLFDTETIRYFTACANLVAGSSRALGWDTPTAESSSGTRLSSTAFGHTGFTGTSLWIDPEQDFFAVLLTNRVHPSRENSKLAALRPLIYDALAEG